MTEPELQQQREHEAAMNAERQAFVAEWPDASPDAPGASPIQRGGIESE